MKIAYFDYAQYHMMKLRRVSLIVHPILSQTGIVVASSCKDLREGRAKLSIGTARRECDARQEGT